MLRIKKSITERILRIDLSGVADESIDLESEIGLPTQEIVNVYCREIDRINSGGVRIWTNFFSYLRRNQIQLTFYECSPCIVAQCNCFEDFLLKDEVHSIVTIYLCRSCHVETRKIFTLEELRKLAFKPPSIVCTKCGKQAEFDENPSDYFSFLAEK